MSHRSELTVAIPSCNGARHLRETVRSILGQTGVRFDLIVCDDRSNDETLSIVRDLAGDRARIEVNSERLGLAGNWNRCVSLSQTEWVSVFHQDDIMKPWYLAVMLGAIQSTRDVPLGLVAGDTLTIDDQGFPVSSKIIDPGGNLIPAKGAYSLRTTVLEPGGFVKFLTDRNPLRCSAVMLNRKAHSDVGGFDPALHYVVDWDFWLKVARRWGVAWRSGDPSVLVRWHARSETHRFKNGTADLDETFELLRRIASEANQDKPGKQSLVAESKGRRRLARAFLNRAYDALHAGQTDLARHSLRRAVSISPRIIGTILADPRLAGQLATLTLAPSLAARLFGHHD